GLPLAEHGGRRAGPGLPGFCSVLASQFARNVGCKSKWGTWTAVGARRERSRSHHPSRFPFVHPGSPPPP
ncbi:hypothetical protein P7K49_004233, partial [Saguinus oedipus]